MSSADFIIRSQSRHFSIDFHVYASQPEMKKSHAPTPRKEKEEKEMEWTCEIFIGFFNVNFGQ